MAIGTGNAADLRLLLEAGADPNGPFEATGLTPLMIVETKEMAEALLSYGADPNLADTQGMTALHHAVFAPEALGLLPLLLDHGAKIDVVADGYSQQTPLLAARQLFFEGGDPSHGSAVLRLLVTHGADIDAGDDFGYTLLHTAAVNNKVDLARTAVALGIDTETRCNDGSTALDYALDLGSEEVAKLLQDDL